MNSALLYKIKTASGADILKHLTSCDQNFTPPLSTKVNLADYAEKLYNHSVTFEAWDNKLLAGLLAAYNNQETRICYITNVSLLKSYHKLGIATNLLKMCIAHAGKLNFNEINLEVSSNNLPAIKLYDRFNFKVFEEKNGQVFMKMKF